MLLHRLLGFFQDQRNGTYVKPGVAALFDAYCQAHILPLSLARHGQRASEEEHALLCQWAGLPEDALLSYLITDFLHTQMLTAILEEAPLPQAEALLDRFLEHCILPHMRLDVLEKYAETFCALHSCAKQIIGEEAGDD